MNLSQLRMFLDVVKYGSLSKTARQYSLTQPAVTRKIQRLEKEIGIDLFERGVGHQLSLTRRGYDFLEFAQKVDKDYTRLQAFWRSQRHDVQGSLELAAGPSHIEFFLPSLLAAFKAHYPAVNLTLTTMNSPELEDGLVKCDVIFTTKQINKPDTISQVVWHDEFVLVVPNNHHLASSKQKTITLSQLEGETLINADTTFDEVVAILETYQQELPPHKLLKVMGDLHSVLHLIAAGTGCGFMPSKAVDETNSAVSVLRLSDIVLDQPLYMAYIQSQAQNQLLHEFVNFMQTANDFTTQAQIELYASPENKKATASIC